MPTFRTTPSLDLQASIRRAVASQNLGPDSEVGAEYAAARTAKELSLADKARAEVERIKGGEADRRDPALTAEYAGHVAGIDRPSAFRLAANLRGDLEQPALGDVDDAAAAGVEPSAYRTAAPPSVTPTQTQAFQGALASAFANRIATGNTNAEQLAHSAERFNENSILSKAAEAAAAGDTAGVNLNAAGVLGKKELTPYKTNAQGVVTNEYTGTTRNVPGSAASRGGKPPAGYRYLGDGTLEPIPGGPADTKPAGGDAVEMAAHRYLIDGTLPPNLGRGAQGSKNTMAILNRAADLAKERGQDGEAARIAQLSNKASQSALTQLSKQEAMVGAFEKNFIKNADLAIEQSNKVDRTGVPVINRWVLAGKKNISGDPDVAVLDTAIKASVNEYTKIISGSMGNAAMAEGEIKKVNDLLNSAQTPQQVLAVLTFMKKETGNRMSSFADQKAEITRGMRGGAPAPAAAASAPGALPAGWSIKKVK
jgi:hypothetical protein